MIRKKQRRPLVTNRQLHDEIAAEENKVSIGKILLIVLLIVFALIAAMLADSVMFP